MYRKSAKIYLKGGMKMNIRVPEYFTRFKCIADKCTDSCCIGWEIDIDERTKEKYRTVCGDIGKEIAEKTQHGHFPLTENGRCSFLDESGLCRIISALGDGYLCEICAEHPRYYGVGRDGLEGGLGLGCPEAAKLILSLEEMPKFTLIESEDSKHAEDEYAEVSHDFREALYEIIFSKDTDEIIGGYLAFAEAADAIAFDLSTGADTNTELPKSFDSYGFDTAELSRYAASLFLDCEALSDEWENALTRAVELGIRNPDIKRFRCLLFYFTHRYVRECVDDMSFGQRILFSLYSALTVAAIAKDESDADEYARAAVLFSKNIEYSTDNVDDVIDRIDITPII